MEVQQGYFNYHAVVEQQLLDPINHLITNPLHQSVVGYHT